MYMYVHVVRSTHVYTCTYVTMYIHGVDVLSTPRNRRKKGEVTHPTIAQTNKRIYMYMLYVQYMLI